MRVFLYSENGIFLLSGMLKMKKTITYFIRSVVAVLAGLSLLPGFGCTSGNSSKKNNTTKHDNSIIAPGVYKKPPSAFNDTLVIKGKAAVFFNPDSVQLNNIKAMTESRVFDSDCHDCFYQMRNARNVIKQYWPELPIIETSAARYLLFIKADKGSACTDLNSLGAMCGIILFDPQKAPELIDMMNIDTALRFYYEK
jgi:hypothetical protein